jgi:hypothetical protein
MLLELQSPSALQLGLDCDAHTSARTKRVMATLDARFGRDTVVVRSAAPTSRLTGRSRRSYAAAVKVHSPFSGLLFLQHLGTGPMGSVVTLGSPGPTLIEQPTGLLMHGFISLRGGGNELDSPGRSFAEFTIAFSSDAPPLLGWADESDDKKRPHKAKHTVALA